MREEPLGKAKPFDIPKRVVWEAYQRVKANRGAAGVDDQSIEAFEQDVKNNLFKLWNRLSSGSYFPSPVKRVAIKKRQALLKLRDDYLAKMGDKFSLTDFHDRLLAGGLVPMKIIRREMMGCAACCCAA